MMVKATTMLRRFEAAVRAETMAGSQPPDEAAQIRRDFRKLRKQMQWALHSCYMDDSQPKPELKTRAESTYNYDR